MTKKELFDWAEQNSRIYPELALLCEANIDGDMFISLPVQYGIYTEQYYYIDENRAEKIQAARTADELLCGNATVELLRGGSAVAVIEDYGTAQALILDCVKDLQKKKKSGQQSKNK